MLAELFMLRMEAIARSINPLGTSNSDTRFVPLKRPTPVTKNSPRQRPRTIDPPILR
jgi:hypothetical protein